MKFLDYLFLVLIILLVILGVQTREIFYEYENIHKEEVNALKVRIEALENKAIEQADYKTDVDKLRTRVDDMTLNYYTLDQILKNMGLTAQKRYVK